MSYEHNNIATRSKLLSALGEGESMGYEHDDIVTVDVMNEAIGGGGGGVFSSANVTLVLDGEIILYDAFYIVDGVLTHYDDIPISTSQVLVMPLTNGSINLGLVNEMPGKELTVSGAATYDGEEDLTITGDCTITLGGK